MPLMPEPKWSFSGQKVNDPVSSLCTTGIKPSIVTGILIQAIRAHYIDPDNIKDEKLKYYQWSAKDEASRIMIDFSYKFNAATLQKAPQILVSLGPMQATHVALGDRAVPSVNRHGDFDGIHQLKTITGQHEVHITAQDALAAQRLGEETFFYLLENSTVIINDLNFGNFDVNVLSGVSLVREPQEHYVSTITITWATMHRWRVQAIAPVFKKTFSNQFLDEQL